MSDQGEQLLLVAEEYTESLGGLSPRKRGCRPTDREDELSVREHEEELLVEVFGEQKGLLLRAGGTEVKGLAGKRAEILESARRV